MIVSYTLSSVMTFGNWLKNKRAELRVSGAELERLSGVSRQYISNLERELVYEKTQNLVKPSVEIVDRLARALGVNGAEARLAAGYAADAGDEVITLTVSPDLRVWLLRTDFSEEDRRRIEMVLRTSYETAIAMINADHAQPPEPPKLVPMEVPYYGEGADESKKTKKKKAQ